MTRCISQTVKGTVCKRNCTVDSDFCKQHNPLNKLDDLTCAVCLEDIKNPMDIGCRHIFCKECISEAVIQNRKCPCCRADVTDYTLFKCVCTIMGLAYAYKFVLYLDMMRSPEKWRKVWTPKMLKMTKQYLKHNR